MNHIPPHYSTILAYSNVNKSSCVNLVNSCRPTAVTTACFLLFRRDFLIDFPVFFFKVAENGDNGYATEVDKSGDDVEKNGEPKRFLAINDFT